jgi:hypothetical protein
MSRKYPVYGVKRDYPKIDLFARAKPSLPWQYVGSSTWSRTLREAVDRYHACMGLERGQVRAAFDRKATGA